MSVSSLALIALAAAYAPADSESAKPVVTSETSLDPALQDDAPAEEAEEPHWTGQLNFGGTVARGNSKVTGVALSFNAELDRGKDRWSTQGYWNYTETEDVITQRNAGVSGEYDYFTTEKLFYLGTAGVETDTQADVDLRWWIGPGVGYQFYKEDEESKVSLNASAAITYFAQDFGTAPDEEYAAARLAYGFGWQATETTRVEQDMSLFPSLEDSDDFFGRLDTRIKVSISEKLFTQLQWIYDYNNSPPAGFDRADNRLILTVGWLFG